MKTPVFIIYLAICFLSIPAQAAEMSSGEIISELLIRGNYSIPDETITQLAGIQTGIPIETVDLEALKQKLLRSGKFEWVEAAKRYRSISRTDHVVLVITVKEKPSIRSKLMFFPILSGSDEYGLSYGVSVSAKDLLGVNEKLSVPLTWGGIRRAAIEGTFDLHNPVFQTLAATGGISRKENPYYHKGDFRKEIQATARSRFGRFEFNVQSGWNGVRFDARSSDLASIGAGILFDTRQNINVPRDAVYAGFFYKRLSILSGGPGYNLYTLDFRGYKGLIGQTILAGQFLYQGTDGRLPDYERHFLGGANTLRGYKPGAFTGDNSAVASLELRVPLTPLRKMYSAGIEGFIDSGAIYEYGMSMGNAQFKHGAGLGAYFLIAGFGLKADLAYNMHDAFRVHFGTGFRF
jgi:outer membrane protein assembly factor BamA